MTKRFPLVPALLLMANTALADSLHEASQIMCEKARECALAEMQASTADLPPQLKAMMEQAVGGMCQSLQASFPADVMHPLAEAAAGCMRSFSDITCDELTNLEDVPTPACESYRRKAESYQVD